MSTMVAISSSRTSAGSRNAGMLVRIRPPGLVVLLEDDHLVAERHQVVGHGERRRPGADADDAPAVLAGRDHREAVGDVAAEVGGDPLQAADRHRRAVDPGAPARGLAGPVAGAPEDPRKHVGLAVGHVRVGVPPLGDQTDVFGDVGVGRAGPLAVDDPMEIIRVRRVGWVHELIWIPGLGPCVPYMVTPPRRSAMFVAIPRPL